MPHAKFDHAAHTGFTCVSCHAKALTSTESSDILLPELKLARPACAGAGVRGTRCFECHQKNLPRLVEAQGNYAEVYSAALRTGGR